jgi:aromatic-L-amino-acid/L-tryptophan decarboxylase
MTEPERPLRLDAPREEALEHAVKLVTEAWRSFDRFRPEEPPLDERVRELLRSPLPQEPVSVHETLDDAARILDESIAQPRPRYLAFIGSSGLEIGTIADLLAHTYDINLAVDARAATEIENQAVRWAAEFIGYPPDSAGAFTSGGTVSNTSALAAAREFALPKSRFEGLEGHRVAVYCSEEVHYSITRAIEMLGIGSRNLRAIALGADRGMRTDLLADAIDEDGRDGITPIAVVATAGTTLTGAIDPLDSIADVCEERGIWLHVDGAYGLPAASARPELFRGFERAQSVSVDAHKWLYLPKACGIVLVRREEDLAASFAHEQGYLPHQRHELHAVDITFEYSRPFRALKLWLAMRAHGAAAFREAIERNLAEAKLLYDRVSAAPDFEALGEPKLSIVPFRHVPEGIGDLNEHNQRLADALQADGRFWIASALIDDEVWLRPCFVNFRTTEEDVLALVEVAREVGERLVAM